MAPLIDADMFRRYCPRCADSYYPEKECSILSPHCLSLIRECIMERLTQPGEPVLGIRLSGSYPVSEGYY